MSSKYDNRWHNKQAHGKTGGSISNKARAKVLRQRLLRQRLLRQRLLRQRLLRPKHVYLARVWETQDITQLPVIITAMMDHLDALVQIHTNAELADTKGRYT